jgi:hypothetical protein
MDRKTHPLFGTLCFALVLVTALAPVLGAERAAGRFLLFQETAPCDDGEPLGICAAGVDFTGAVSVDAEVNQTCRPLPDFHKASLYVFCQLRL